MRGYRKADVDFHSDRGPLRPAVNVKVDYYKEVMDASERMPWVTEDQWEATFQWAREDGWEELNELARDIWGHGMVVSANGARRYQVQVYSEGRSGGWAVVMNGPSDDVELWDAIELNRWTRFATGARRIADGIPEQMVWLAEANFGPSEAEVTEMLLEDLSS